VLEESLPLDESDRAYDDLVEAARTAEVVLIGEASHGTHEFYRERADLTRRLIEEAGFDAVVVEADWPQAERVDRYVRGAGEDTTADGALGGFREFPIWMWRNEVVAEFVDWLRERNERSGQEPHVGFHGMDLYSLRESADAVVAYLERVDPAAAERARDRYACFGAYEQPEAYGRDAARTDDEACARAAEEQLAELEQLAAGLPPTERREAFSAARNAAVVRGAEAYYRTLFTGEESTWNLRDRHMFETLEALREQLTAEGRSGRLVVWAHNTHVGDARATAMAEQGELSVGQLVRERYEGRTLTIGFTTYSGTVTAARQWGGEPEQRNVRRALNESYEALFHRATEGPRPDDLVLDLRPEAPLANALDDPRLERAIGVLYRPETERGSHYFEATLPEQFDVVIHVDQTTAVQPLDEMDGG
jgi:erythromycin esterase-like protein